MVKRSLIHFVPLLILLGTLSLQAQTPPAKTILDGVFTEAQAARGRDNYELSCTNNCHAGEEPDATEIFGDEFIERWREDSLVPLINYMKVNMPGNAPGKFEESYYVDVIAHLLELSGYKAGPTELRAADAGSILIVGKTGPQPLPNQALVSGVGCLAEGAGGAWILTNVGKLSRVKFGDKTTPEDLKEAESNPPGTQSLQLRNFEIIDGFNPVEHKGKKILVKGVYSRQTAGARISATAIGVVTGSCAP